MGDLRVIRRIGDVQIVKHGGDLCPSSPSAVSPDFFSRAQVVRVGYEGPMVSEKGNPKIERRNNGSSGAG